MTITYDPKHPSYLDEADVRDEMTRVFDVCHGCRRCVSLCTSFPTLSEYIDRHDDHDAGRLTPAQQDQVVDECFQCKLCHLNCPYVPAVHELAIDFPRLMLRADAMRHGTGQTGIRDTVTTVVMGRTDLVGRLATRFSPLANKVVAAQSGSMVRKLLQVAVGVSSQRLLQPFAKQRFTAWFKNRPKLRIDKRQGRVAVFPTCMVEYQKPDIGHDLVKVYERNGIECQLTEGTRCCGAPLLFGGDLDRFNKVAAKNVTALARSVRKGLDIVVTQPTCGYILKNDYVDYVGGDDAQLVATHTYDASEYLMKVHKAEGTALDIVFGGDVPDTVTYHVPSLLRAQNVGLRSRDLIKLTGAKVKLVQANSAVDGMWGLRAHNADIAIPVARQLADQVRQANGDTVVGDCNLANTVIAEQTGESPLHPLQLIARAYGISSEQTR